MATSPEKLASGKVVLDHPVDAVARLTICNLDRRNALDHEILDALATAIRGLVDGIDVRCLIITGRERSFSAGYDIANITEKSFSKEAEQLVAHPFHDAMAAIASFPYPTLAVINGHALGGGLELAIQCDLRIAADSAKLGMPPAKLGLVYSHTGLRKFIETIGVPRTKELFLIGRNLSATEAQEINLVGDVVAYEELEPAALKLATEIASNAPLSLTGNKRVIQELAKLPILDDQTERKLMNLRIACFDSGDFREGIKAFSEKRKPKWQGR